MDFNDIKNTWQNSFKGDNLEKAQIEKQMKVGKQTDTLLNKVLKNYRNELLLGVILYVAIIVWIFYLGKVGYAIIVTIVLTALVSPLFLFAINSLKQIKQANNYEQSLKDKLTKTIQVLGKYVDFNMSLIYKIVVLPSSLIAGMFVGITILSDQDFLETLQGLSSKAVIVGLLLAFVMSVVLVTASQFFVKRMYKKHLDELKQCLNELNE